MMTSEQGELLSAFVDGVAVDPDQLAEALADPEAPGWLVMCARLRGEIAGDARRPSPAFYQRMHSVLKPRGIWRFFGGRAASVPWPIAAGAAAVLVVAAFGIGRWALGTPEVSGPQPVTVVPPTTAGPPQASQILRFGSPGDWRESVRASGGIP